MAALFVCWLAGGKGYGVHCKFACALPMTSKNPVLFEHILQIATAFMRGRYDVGSVVHGFYQFNNPTTVNAWVRALAETPNARPHVFVELRLLTRVFMQSYFGGVAHSPVWASRAFEIFSYRLLEQSAPNAPENIPRLLDLIGAFRDVLVIPVKSSTLAVITILETVRESVVYKDSIPTWAVHLGEHLAPRVLADEDAMEHATASTPILNFFSRMAQSMCCDTHIMRSLVYQAMRANNAHRREQHRAAVTDCPFRQNNGRLDTNRSAVCFTNYSLKRQRADRILFVAKRPKSSFASMTDDRSDPAALAGISGISVKSEHR